MGPSSQRMGPPTIPARFSDYFGGIANVLAMVGVVIALILQQQELSEQRKAIREQRDELAKQAKALEEQLTAARNDTLLRTLTTINQDYRSPEILDGVFTLWELFRTLNRDSAQLVAEYARTFQEDKSRIALAPPADGPQLWKGTLHHKRRVVSHFYQHIAGLRESGIASPDLLARRFWKDDLDIIPLILVPIEKWLHEHLYGKPFDRRLPLENLYEEITRSRSAE